MTTNACLWWDFRTSLLDDRGKSCYLRSGDEEIPDYHEQKDELEVFLKENCKKYCFQLEAGNENGYLHFQGRMVLKNKMRSGQLFDLIDSFDMAIPNYLEPTNDEVRKRKDMEYVCKGFTQVRGPWTSDDREVFIPIQYRGFDDKLYPFQKKILEAEECRDFRTVNLIVDLIGLNGKSLTAALADLIGNGIDVPPIMDAKELVQIVCNQAMSRKERSPSPIIMDLPRSVDKKKLGAVYTAIETIKKGHLYDPRHKYVSWWINSPHIWVFTNAHPDLSYLSEDRWKIWQITDDKDLIPYVPPKECFFEEVIPAIPAPLPPIMKFVKPKNGMTPPKAYFDSVSGKIIVQEDESDSE